VGRGVAQRYVSLEGDRGREGAGGFLREGIIRPSFLMLLRK
jgi:hypothetical protein